MAMAERFDDDLLPVQARYKGLPLIDIDREALPAWPVAIFRHPINIALTGFGKAIDYLRPTLDPSWRAPHLAGTTLIEKGDEFVTLVAGSNSDSVAPQIGREELVGLLAAGIEDEHVPEEALDDVSKAAVRAGLNPDNAVEAAHTRYIGPATEVEAIVVPEMIGQAQASLHLRVAR